MTNGCMQFCHSSFENVSPDTVLMSLHPGNSRFGAVTTLPSPLWSRKMSIANDSSELLLYLNPSYPTVPLEDRALMEYCPMEIWQIPWKHLKTLSIRRILSPPIIFHTRSQSPMVIRPQYVPFPLQRICLKNCATGARS